MSRLSTDRAWPFCQVDHDISPALYPASRFPVVIPKAKMEEWMYRVRAWEINFNVTATYKLFAPSPDWTTTMIGTTTNRTDNSRTEEEEMACAVGGSQTQTVTNGETIVRTPDPDIIGDVSVFFSFGLGQSSSAYGISGTQRFLRDGDDYLPTIYLQFLGNDVLFHTESTPGTAGSIAVTMDGYSFSLKAASAGAFSISAYSGTVTITPVEWWEHDPGDGGGPVWNAGTGAPERDPETIP